MGPDRHAQLASNIRYTRNGMRLPYIVAQEEIHDNSVKLSNALQR
jgi:hypothetical protein